MKKTFHLVSLGCPKNRVDSESIMGVMFGSGYEYTEDPDKALVVIVNTCAFIEPAVSESIDLVLDFAHHNSGAILVVTGCLNRRYPEGLHENLPEIDALVDPSNIVHIPCVIEKTQKFLKHTKADPNTGATSGNTLIDPETRKESPRGQRRIITTPGYSYLRISDGCSRKCAYCAIPAIRGGLKSVPVYELIEEARFLAERKCNELVIVGQDITSYGKDLGDKTALISLLKQLEGLDGLNWIRLMYLHPKGVTKELTDLVKKSRKILPYLDIPFQHVSEKVLRSMGRSGNSSELRDLVTMLRAEIPELVIRTTFMVGFPTEGEKEFSELVGFVQDMALDRVGVFPYYQEEGTRAFDLGDPIPRQTKEDRIRELTDIQSSIIDKKNRTLIGEISSAIIEGASPETDLLLQARSWRQAPEVDGIMYITAGVAGVGEIKKVRITQANGPDLFAEIIDSSDQ